MKHLFSNKLSWLVLLLFSIASGCGRGCSCDSTIDSDSERRKVDGVKVKIEAEKVKTTTTYFTAVHNSNAPFGCGCVTSKSYSYSFVYNLSLPKRSTLYEACRIGIDENTDMDFALEWFVVKFSPDKKHFATGTGQYVYAVYHLLDEGVPFASPGSVFYLDTEEKTVFENINWKNFKSPDKIAEDLILDLSAYDSMSYEHQNLLAQALNELSIPSRFDIMLLTNWPQSDLSPKVLTEDRVRRICKKSDAWEKSAIEKIFNSINTEEYLSRNADLLLAINDDASLTKADKILFPHWLEQDGVTNYVDKRLNDKRNKVESKNITLIKQKANTIVTNIPTDFMYPELKPAFDMLIRLNDKSSFDAALKLMLSSQIHENLYSDISDILFDNYKAFSKEQQKFIVAELPKLFSVIPSVYRREYYQFLCKKATDEVLLKLKSTYASDLQNLEC